jgi:hypothetical protein
MPVTKVEERPLGYGKPAGPGLRCPRCQGSLVRVRRLPLDRVISLLFPRRRYRCVAIGCGWEGALRVKR